MYQVFDLEHIRVNLLTELLIPFSWKSERGNSELEKGEFCKTKLNEFQKSRAGQVLNYNPKKWRKPNNRTKMAKKAHEPTDTKEAATAENQFWNIAGGFPENSRNRFVDLQCQKNEILLINAEML